MSLPASKQLPLSLLLFKTLWSVLFVFVLHWFGHIYPFRRDVEAICVTEFCFVLFFLRLFCAFPVSCQQHSESIILGTQNMSTRTLGNVVIAPHLAFDLCGFVLCNAIIDVLILKYFPSLIFVLKPVFFKKCTPFNDLLITLSLKI